MEEARSLERVASTAAQSTAKLREISGRKSMEGMIRLPWIEGQSKRDQTGKKEFSVGGELQM